MVGFNNKYDIYILGLTEMTCEKPQRSLKKEVQKPSFS